MIRKCFFLNLKDEDAAIIKGRKVFEAEQMVSVKALKGERP